MVEPDFEQRLGYLEDDVKILKNEIQQILLDIREQLTEHSVSTPPRSRESESLMGQAGLPEGMASVLTEAENEGIVDLDMVTSVGAWMAGKVQKFGTDRIVQLLKLYEMTGRLPTGVRGVLEKLITLDGRHEGSDLSPGDSAALLRELDELLGQPRKGRPGGG